MTTDSSELACPFTGTDAAPSSISRVHTATGDEAWKVCGYHKVKELFTDVRLGRSHPTPETAARSSESVFFGRPFGNFETEPADNARMRGLLNPLFSAKRMRELTPRVAAFTTQLLDDMAEKGSPADLHKAFAEPLPLLVISELLGVPYEDRAQFRIWSEALFDTSDGAKSGQAGAEWFLYCKSLVERLRREPGDGVIAKLCEVPDLADDAIATLAMGLLLAGHETTVVEIGLCTVQLLRNPAQWQKLVDQPELVPAAIEELLRVHDSTAFARYARTDMEIDGVTVRTGDLVLLDVDSANHDPEIFTNARRLDVTRAEGQHLAFGYGLHYCTGAPLARIELQVAFGQLISRFPTLHLAVDPDELTVRENVVTKGLTALPVAW